MHDASLKIDTVSVALLKKKNIIGLSTKTDIRIRFFFLLNYLYLKKKKKAIQKLNLEEKGCGYE